MTRKTAAGPAREDIQDLSRCAALAVDEHRAAPGACVGAAVLREGTLALGLGAAGKLWFPASPPRSTPAAPPPVTSGTVYDLASVTKPLTALTLARLERAGALRGDEPLRAFLPELATSRSAEVPLDLLASHRAGLDGHRPLYAPLLEGRRPVFGEALAIAADARRDDCAGAPPEEGFPPVYSDLGYLLLGEALARRAGLDLDALITREITAPLGLAPAAADLAPAIASARAFRTVEPRWDDRVAPTEGVAFRGGVVRGAVHDENAWALTADASAGHAGLFGDALAVTLLGVAILEALAGERPTWLSPSDLVPVLRARPGGSHRAGFDSRSGPSPSSGSRLGPSTFGHLGFTGTSLWIDPDARFVGVLLTNRVHPTRATDAIRRARPATYDALAEVMLDAR
ncbi:serine hydrolase domain-containing protein [Chondromyces apiculatus]|uniref:Beta-lactamase class C and other penicillin binding protein n=1 Tax=Chondromyces apiculatus DSM 436 TaxID=1192034 RepID=A0A017T8Y2_9BACT|nr:serine hydrolase domain-containing protein [Chondromyces apiculatus]EYF05723.1 Beta-lactamase class C and other penicillin binding protein [Chondromyces apiculatus DSM 436]